MDLLKYKLLQSYLKYDYDTIYNVSDFKPYINYCRIKIKLGKIYLGSSVDVKLKVNYTSSYNSTSNIPNNLYYSIGTLKTWDADLAIGSFGGKDYENMIKSNSELRYKWCILYSNLEHNITIPTDELQSQTNGDKAIYIFLYGSIYDSCNISVNVPKTEKTDIKVELEGNLCSLQYGDIVDKWENIATYYFKFTNSDFTSVKNAIISPKANSSYMFEGNKYLKDIPDCIKNMETSKFNNNTKYNGMFLGCTSLEEVTLNIKYDTNDNNINLSNVFTGCTGIRNINIKYDDVDYINSTQGEPAAPSDLFASNSILFGGCSSVEKVVFDLYSPFDTKIYKKKGYGAAWSNGNNEFFNIVNYAVGGNIKNKYLTFPNFSSSNTLNTEYNDENLAKSALHWINYYNYTEYDSWKLGSPVNSTMPNIGKGDGYEAILNFYLKDMHTKIGYFICPGDTVYSGIIKDVDNFNNIKLENYNLGSAKIFVRNEYILGSFPNHDYYHILCTESDVYAGKVGNPVKVTDMIFENNYQPGDGKNLIFKPYID